MFSLAPVRLNVEIIISSVSFSAWVKCLANWNGKLQAEVVGSEAVPPDGKSI